MQSEVGDAERGRDRGSCPWVSARLGQPWALTASGLRPWHVDGAARGTDISVLPGRKGPGQGPLFGGWKWPGLFLGILPVSDLAEVRGGAEVPGHLCRLL